MSDVKRDLVERTLAARLGAIPEVVTVVRETALDAPETGATGRVGMSYWSESHGTLAEATAAADRHHAKSLMGATFAVVARSGFTVVPAWSANVSDVLYRTGA
jgi:hypothetical protein